MNELAVLEQVMFLSEKGTTYADRTDDLSRGADLGADASNLLIAEAAHGPVLPRYKSPSEK